MNVDSPKVILVVEDDQPINSIIADVLIEEGYKVLQAYSASEALTILESVKCDLITLDYSMPGINGEQLLGMLPEHLKHISIIVISATPKLFHLTEQVKAILPKPFELDELCKIVRSLVM